MKIALIGASGMIGSRLLVELTSRGHDVTAIARNPEKIAAAARVTAKKGDVSDGDGLAKLIAGHDAVISSVHFLQFDPEVLLGAVRASGARRYLVVGGAGSLEVAPGITLVSTPHFPDEYKAEAIKGGEYLDKLRQDKTLDWTYLSPSMMIAPGERTGKFRLGKDELLTHLGKSSISAEDFAVALVDEIEKPAHSRQRFTVGY